MENKELRNDLPYSPDFDPQPKKFFHGIELPSEEEVRKAVEEGEKRLEEGLDEIYRKQRLGWRDYKDIIIGSKAA